MNKNEVVAVVAPEVKVEETKAVDFGAFGGRIISVDADGLNSSRTGLHYKSVHLVVDTCVEKRTAQQAYDDAKSGKDTTFEMRLFSGNKWYHKACTAQVGMILIANGNGTESINNGNVQVNWDLNSFDVFPAKGLKDIVYASPMIVEAAEEAGDEEELDY